MWFLIFFLMAFLPMWGQGSVTIFGVVADASGHVVPDVPIEIRNTETGAARRVISDARGNYVVTQLPVAIYTVSAEYPGFKKFVQENIRVQVDENRQVAIILNVGEVSEKVVVSAEGAPVETRTGTLKQVVDAERIVGLPLNGRNPLQLLLLVPGAGATAPADQAQNSTVSINGSRTNANNYVLDGGDNHDPYFNTPAVFPSPDALLEFSIQTNAYSAEYGRNAGGLLNAITKSGTNQFHGSLFEFLRNEKLNARSFFANQVPPFKRNQFGATLGGPLLRDRTFFFFPTRARAAAVLRGRPRRPCRRPPNASAISPRPPASYMSPPRASPSPAIGSRMRGWTLWPSGSWKRSSPCQTDRTA